MTMSPEEETRVSSDESWLHLFTSTIRPLYVRDAVEVVCAADGDRRTFRYAGKYIPPDLKTLWVSERGLVGRRVAVHLAIQHPAGLHDPVYLTLRSGTVVGSRRDGDTYTVTFTLNALLPPPPSPDLEGTDAKHVRTRAEHVKDHSGKLAELLGNRTPEVEQQAVLGPDPTSLPTVRVGSVADSADAGLAFETLVRFLAPALFFPKYWYVRAAALLGENGKSKDPDDRGIRKLTAGKSATLRLHHYQVDPPTDGVTLNVAVPEGLTLLSPASYDIGSRYDVIDVQMYAPHRDSPVAGEVVVSVDGPLEAPVLRIPVLVRPGVAEGGVAPVGGLVAASLAVTPSIVDSWPVEWRVLMAVAGVLLGGYVTFHRRGRGLPPLG